jgi:hypothetical protein
VKAKGKVSVNTLEGAVSDFTVTQQADGLDITLPSVPVYLVIAVEKEG